MGNTPENERQARAMLDTKPRVAQDGRAAAPRRTGARQALQRAPCGS